MSLAVSQKVVVAFKRDEKADQRPPNPDDPSQDGRFDTETLPGGEEGQLDRRGPLRPHSLISTRSRMNSWTLAWIFRGGDLAVMLLASLAVFGLAGFAGGVATERCAASGSARP